MNAPEPAGTPLELRLGAPAERAEAFDTWLRDHVADVLHMMRNGRLER